MKKTFLKTSGFPITPDTQDAAQAVAALVKRLFSCQGLPILIAVGGPGGTGKSHFSKGLAGLLPDSAVFPLDDYKTSRAERKKKGIFGPHPEANEMELLNEHLAMLKSGLGVDKPVYNPLSGQTDRLEHFPSTKITILDGEIATYERFRPLVDLSIFIDADWLTQMNTRLSRDIQTRGYSRDKAWATFFGSNVKEFSKYGAESKEWADVLLFCERNYFLKVKHIAEDIQLACLNDPLPQK